MPAVVKMNDKRSMHNARNLSREEIVQDISLINGGRSKIR